MVMVLVGTALVLGRQVVFTPQPYGQVRANLLERGKQKAAARIGYKSRDTELKESFINFEFLNGSYLVFSKLLIGYGYQMWLPIVWAFGFVTAGAFVFRQTSEARREHMPYGISYSFDMLLPLIRLRQKHYEIDLKEGMARYYFYVHKIAGWVIGSFIVAGLAGFTK